MTIVKIRGAASETRCPKDSSSSPISLSLSNSVIRRQIVGGGDRLLLVAGLDWIGGHSNVPGY